jgi:multidrug resistance efflux pump
METLRRSPVMRIRRVLRYTLITAIFVGLLIWFANWLFYRLTHVTTDAAFVKADIVELTTLVPGHVNAILVDEGYPIQAGQILLTLDDRDYQQALERAEAALVRAELQYRRAKTLHASRTIADMKFEEAEAAYKEAKAAREQALLNVWHTRIQSPFDGIVAKRYVEPGDFVAPGLPALAVYDPGTMHVMANLEESKVKGVRLGAPVDLFVEAYPGTLRGRVLRIGEATAAEFALIPRDVSAGEFTKVVQRVPIKISVPPREQAPFLRPGLSVSIGVEKP